MVLTGVSGAETGGSKLGAALFLLVGIAALLIGVWQGWSTARFVGRAVAVTGTVTENTAHPTVEFHAADGTVVHYRQNGMGGRPVGTAVPVLYDPADPAGTATVNSFWQLWFSTVGPALLGIAFIALILFGAEIELRPGRY